MTNDERELRRAKQDNTARKAAVIIVSFAALGSMALIFWVLYRLLDALLP